MILIVGLGNPGEEYVGTRHNVGFAILDALLNNKVLAAATGPKCELSLSKKFKSELCELNVKGEKILFCKPQTFMNLSGEAVAKIVKFYKIKPENIWVISDEVDMPLSRIRIRSGGSSGGHKGLESVIQKLGEYFVRIRIGINRIDGDPRLTREQAYDKPWTTQFVLSRFSDRERPVLDKAIMKTVDYIVSAIKVGRIYDTTMETI